jgi:hypothetical protein
LDRLTGESREVYEAPSEWIEKHFYVPEPRDVETGEILPPGPIRLAPHQRRIIDAALARDEKGRFLYTTIVYSAPKKSGKSALASAVALYMAYHNAHSHVFCLANDGKQSTDRIYGPIRKNFELHKSLGGIFSNEDDTKMEVILTKNSTKIEAIPCDAAGESGAEPLATIWSELWGFNSQSKRKLWTELTVPPTKFGRAICWVESYAGFIGESDILWQLYENGQSGVPHPDFPDLPVTVNEKAAQFTYWDTEPRMVWQTPEYYRQEAEKHSPVEFNRIHRNQWGSAVDAFINKEWWEACVDTSIPVLQNPDVPVVVAIDAAVDSDCSAIVAVTRHPFYPQSSVAIRHVKIFKPGPGVSILRPIEDTLRTWGQFMNIVVVAFDSFQMEDMIERMRRGLVAIPDEEIDEYLKEFVLPNTSDPAIIAEEKDNYIRKNRLAVERWYYKFSQHAPRAVADKRLYDMIVHKNLRYNPETAPGISEREGEESLTKHILQAGVSKSGGQFRLEKLTAKNKIDAAVGLSMATELCMTLDLDNREAQPEEMIKKLIQATSNYDHYLMNLLDNNLRIRADFNG